MAVDENETVNTRPHHGKRRRGPVDGNFVEPKDFLPRPYQVELKDMAKTRNIIIPLGTGTGKTFIAVMLMTSEEFVSSTRMPYADGGKRTVFVVPTVNLVLQQAMVIESHTAMSVGRYYGDLGTDTWTQDDWNCQLESHQVLVMVVEVLRKALTHGFMSMSRINLLILDEAHWAVKDHPYKEVMKFYPTATEPPRVLGLTASLITSKCKPEKICSMIRKLESSLDSSVETSGDVREACKYGTHSELSFRLFEREIALRSDRLEKILYFMNSFVGFLGTRQESTGRNVLKAFRTVLSILDSMGAWAALQASNYHILEITERAAMVASSSPQAASILWSAVSLLRTFRVILTDSMNSIDGDPIRVCISGKMIALLEELSKAQKSSEEGSKRGLCGIVFAEQRAVVKVLCVWLQQLSKKFPAEYGFLKADFVLGTNNNAQSSVTPQSADRQEKALARFRRQELNLILATSVLEEGLDVPRCNLVIRYDLPKSYREYIQSRGRARADNARYILFLDSDKQAQVEAKQRLDDFLRSEQIIMNYVHNRARDGDVDAEDETEADLIPPFQPKAEDGAPRVTLNSAIGLVNRYCLKLPSDSFTKLAPRVTMCTESTGFVCTIRLPINSPLHHPVSGPPMSKKRLAKKAAALEVVKKLYALGELDENFLPKGKEQLTLDDDEEGEEWTRELRASSGPKPGTTKRRVYYDKRLASVLSGQPPVAGEVLRLYVINMKLSCPIPDEQNTRGRQITDPSDSPRVFGFLTRSDLPSIPGFPVFTRSGEVSVTIQRLQKISLSHEQLIATRDFHRFIFDSVLGLEKFPKRFDPAASSSAYFMVPVQITSESIDWDFMASVEAYRVKEAHEEADGVDIKAIRSLEPFTFDRSRYEDAVVKPWYRQKKEYYFYVAKICDDLTPDSHFPDDDVKLFKDYYKSKYDIVIRDSKQPLLDVDHTSARLNLLTPRYVNRKGRSLPMSSAKTKQEKREQLENKQILIPELCDVHPFPASFWRKAVTLPCILYRINSLLVADELRAEVALGAGIGCHSLASDQSWPPLDFGWSLTEVLSQEKEEDDEEKMPEEVKSDFVIDEFDPSKYTWSEKDELEAIDAELMGMNLNGVNDIEEFSSIENWGDESDIINDPIVGSPSAFSGHGTWGLLDNSIPGLQCISASGVNIVGLSQDLAVAAARAPTANPGSSLGDEDEFLSDDDFGILTDEDEAAEFDPSFDISPSTKSRRTRKELINEIQNDAIVLTDSESEGQEPIDEVLDSLEAETDVPRVYMPTGEKREPSATEEKLHSLINTLKSKTKKEANLKANPMQAKRPSPEHGPKFGESLREGPSMESNALYPTIRFDPQANADSELGPSPAMILQALTMSNASDGINLERLETVGDSFLKYAITAYLYTYFPNLHEGKLSARRSKQISNFKLYLLGDAKSLGEVMVASKFEPMDNWLPPGYVAATETPSADGSVPYNLLTQHSIPDKSIADAVEALIGAYLISSGTRGALLFMKWFGLKVMRDGVHVDRNEDGVWRWLPKPRSPLIEQVDGNANALLRAHYLNWNLEKFERDVIGYEFQDKAYLLQAFTHNSYIENQLTDCYQRLEFLGDAVLDFLITRHLYEDPAQHSPGDLTDLRSALVNNTFFASLAVKYSFQKYLKVLSHDLFRVIARYVQRFKEPAASSVDSFMLGEEECESPEDIEVPKALGDIFESVAGAIYLDSGMSLDAVWRVFYRLMRPEIEYFSRHVPKSPIRELLEMAPNNVSFGPPEHIPGKKIRMSVEVFDRGVFVGIGRNKRLAKCTAAKRALRALKA